MKKFITALTALLTITVSATAMSYSQARDRALFLTDKMAYELNLTEEQYEAAYEVNLDYLMSINTYDDLYGAYWTNRNLDLSYILMDWQYRAFCAASYFYRPVYWDAGIWHFSIYARYPHRSYFYFGRPGFYSTYRGGHGWHDNGGRSWYRGRNFNHANISRGHGMKDRFERGDFRGQQNRGFNRGADNARGNRDFNRQSGNNRNYGGQVGTNRNGNSNRPQRYTPSNRNGSVTNQGAQRGTFNGNRNDSRINRESSTRTTVRPERMNRSTGNQFNSNRSSQQSLPSRPSGTFTPRSRSNSSSSVKSAPSRSSGSMSSPSRSSGGSNHGGGGSSHGSGGGHFGGRR